MCGDAFGDKDACLYGMACVRFHGWISPQAAYRARPPLCVTIAYRVGCLMITLLIRFTAQGVTTPLRGGGLQIVVSTHHGNT